MSWCRLVLTVVGQLRLQGSHPRPPKLLKWREVHCFVGVGKLRARALMDGVGGREGGGAVRANTHLEQDNADVYRT